MTLALPRALSGLLLAGWSAMIFVLLTSEKAPVSASFPGASLLFNAGHAVLFGAEALLLGALLAPGEVREPRRGRWLAAALVALAYSVGMEVWQAGLEARSGSVADVLTNAVGAFGVPWALSVSRAPFTWRTVFVIAASLVTAAVAETTGW